MIKCYLKLGAKMTKDLNNININVQDNNESKPIEKIGLAIPIINTIFCSIALVIIVFAIFSVNIEPDASSGLFLFIVPVIVAISVIAYIPDDLCLLFSVFSYNKRKNIYPILTIIFSIIGYVINSHFFNESLL